MTEAEERVRRIKEALAEEPLSLSRVLKAVTAGMDDEKACEYYKTALAALPEKDQT